MLVLEAEPAVDPGAGIEHQFQRPFIATPFAQRAVAVGMGVHQPRHDQTVGRVDVLGIGRRRHTGLADFHNRIAGDEDVRG